MKAVKVILFFVFLFAKILCINAQNSGSVSVNVILNPVQIINVNPLQKVVNIEYQSVSDYEEGVEVVQQEHILLFSTSPYEVNVSMPDGFLLLSDNHSEMSFPTIQIEALVRTGEEETSTSVIELSAVGKRLISNVHPRQATALDVVYRGLGNNIYVENINQNSGKVIYSSKIVYSIVPK